MNEMKSLTDAYPKISFRKMHLIILISGFSKLNIQFFYSIFFYVFLVIKYIIINLISNPDEISILSYLIVYLRGTCKKYKQ